MLGCTVILSTRDRREQKNFSAPANSKLSGIENFRFVTYSAFLFTKNSVQEDVLFPPSNNQWRRQGGGGKGGANAPPKLFSAPHFAPPQFLIISVETISR